jgi:Spy/CpxP family protein refolding chaperone
MRQLTTIATLFSMAILLCFSQMAVAQGPPPGPPPHGPAHAGPKGKDPLREAFFPPEMVMRHQGEIKLSDEQRQYIIKEMQEAQNNFTNWQWNLEAEMQKMEELVKADQIDQTKAIAQLEKVLVLEKNIKTQQLKLMINIKNKLTAEQRKQLQKIKEEHMKNAPKARKPAKPGR